MMACFAPVPPYLILMIQKILVIFLEQKQAPRGRNYRASSVSKC